MGERRICICRNCKSEFPERELHLVEVFPETILEPAEYVGQCPICNATDDGLSSVIRTVTEALCCICTEVVVPDVGDICEECQMELAEREHDKSKGG